MKIALFSDFFYPEISGIADSVILLGKTLAAQGHTVMFVVPWYSKSDYKVIKASRNDEWGGNLIIKRLPSLPVPFSLTHQSRSPLFLGLGIYWVKKFKPDIIHTHSPLTPGYEAWLASKIFKIPLVGTNHTPISEYLKGPKWFVNMACRHYAKFYNKCLFVTTPSQNLLDYMKSYGLTQAGKVVSNPIDITNFSPVTDDTTKKSLKEKFNFSTHTVLYTGRLADEKRVDNLIRAVALVQKDVPNISLGLAGHGSAETNLKDLAEKLGIGDRVKFLGFIDKKTLPSVYMASDLFAIMSTVETQSISLILGMATGLPVIGANSRALPEYINDTNGVVVPAGDYQALAKEIIKIFSDKNLAEKLGRGGVLSAAKYSALNVTREWEEIYKRSIANFS